MSTGHPAAARWLSLLVAAGALLTGCGGPQLPPGVTFAGARSVAGPVTIQGSLVNGSLRVATGQPTRFTLREPSTGATMAVVAPPGVSVPANLTTSWSVVVAGAYDPATRIFQATSVETRVPTRDEQPHT